MRTRVAIPLKWRTPHSERSARLKTRSPTRASFMRVRAFRVVEIHGTQIAIGVVVRRVEELPVGGIVGEGGDGVDASGP